MAHYLAESICELAAPPLQPSFIRLVAHHGDYPTLVLLLHVRPRQLAAGIEVAVYSGTAEDEEGTQADVSRQGAVFAVQQTQAGLEQFAADLIASSPEEYDDGAGPCQLTLPLYHSAVAGAAWDSVQLHLLPPSTVQASAQQGQLSPDWLSIVMPTLFTPREALAAAEVRNRATAYAHKQDALKRRLEQHKREQAAAAAGSPAAIAAGSGTAATTAAPPPQPDSEAEFQQKFRVLRDEAMAQLHTALLAMLRQALRFRGTLEFPGAPPVPSAAAAAVAAGAVGQPEGAADDP